MKIRLYLAAGLFSVADRLRNAMLAQSLKCHSAGNYEIVLPQKEALQFKTPQGVFDLEALAEHCLAQASDTECVFIGCLDGCDADSGQSVEFGGKVAADKERKIILYRTDFRTHLEKELGVNGMFRLRGVRLIYKPCYAVDVPNLNGFMAELAYDIHQAIQRLLAEKEGESSTQLDLSLG